MAATGIKPIAIVAPVGPPQQVSLHEEYRTLSVVYMFLTAFAHPECAPFLNGSKQDGSGTQQPEPHDPLSSLSAILVRTGEVIAAAAAHQPAQSMSVIIAGGSKGKAEEGAKATTAKEDADEEPDYNRPWPPSITALENPRLKTPTVIEPGHSYSRVHSKPERCNPVDAILEDKAYSLNIDPEGPLVNHISTVTEFLERAGRKKKDADSGPRLFEQLMWYIFSVSRSKMRHRITSWTSQGFIHNLCSISFEALKAAVANPKHNTPIDVAGLTGAASLQQFLRDKAHEGSGFLTNIMGNLEPRLELGPYRPRGLLALREMLQHCQVTGNKPRFSDSSFIDFHLLLVATLLSHGLALDKVYRRSVSLDKSEEPIDLKDFEHAFDVALLLWRIARSKLLRTYLNILGGSDLLKKHLGTSAELCQIYSGLTGFNRTINRLWPGGTDADVAEGAEDGIDADDIQPEGVDKERQGSGLEKPRAYMRWLRLQCLHFDAANYLFNYVQRREEAPSIHIMLLAACPEKGLKLGDIDKAISSAVRMKPEPRIDEAGAQKLFWDSLNRLDSKCLSPATPYALRLLANSSSKADRSKALQSLQLRGYVHCEVALATLLACPNIQIQGIQGKDDEDALASFLKGETTIAVSKRCCPLCWDALVVLSKGLKTIRLLCNSHHNCVYSAEMPPWMPVLYLKEIVDMLKARVVQALVELKEQRELELDKTKTHRPSGSTASIQSSGSYSSSNSIMPPPEKDPWE